MPVIGNSAPRLVDCARASDKLGVVGGARWTTLDW